MWRLRLRGAEGLAKLFVYKRVVVEVVVVEVVAVVTVVGVVVRVLEGEEVVVVVEVTLVVVDGRPWALVKGRNVGERRSLGALRHVGNRSA